MLMDYDELKESFALMDDWEGRYQLVIDLGQSLPPMDSALKTPATKVEGCTSQVWIAPKGDCQDGFDFYADSDAHIVKGLIAVLMIIYKGRKPAEVVSFDIEKDFEALGLGEHLSPNRRNGFFAMVGRLQAMAGQKA